MTTVSTAVSTNTAQTSVTSFIHIRTSMLFHNYSGVHPHTSAIYRALRYLLSLDDRNACGAHPLQGMHAGWNLGQPVCCIWSPSVEGPGYNENQVIVQLQCSPWGRFAWTIRRRSFREKIRKGDGLMCEGSRWGDDTTNPDTLGTRDDRIWARSDRGLCACCLWSLLLKGLGTLFQGLGCLFHKCELCYSMTVKWTL